MEFGKLIWGLQVPLTDTDDKFIHDLRLLWWSCRLLFAYNRRGDNEQKEANVLKRCLVCDRSDDDIDLLRRSSGGYLGAIRGSSGDSELLHHNFHVPDLNCRKEQERSIFSLHPSVLWSWSHRQHSLLLLHCQLVAHLPILPVTARLGPTHRHPIFGSRHASISYHPQQALSSLQKNDVYCPDEQESDRLDNIRYHSC